MTILFYPTALLQSAGLREKPAPLTSSRATFGPAPTTAGSSRVNDRAKFSRVILTRAASIPLS